MVKKIVHSIYVFALLSFLICSCNNESNLPTSNSEFNFSVGIDKKTQVALLPFSGADAAYSALLKSEIELFYSCEVIIMKEHPLPAFAFYKPRNRYKADSLLKYLSSNLPKECDLIIGITGKDISTKNEQHEDWGVFGLGFLGGPSCVVSDLRLKKTALNKKHLQERVTKVSLHELGHTFGLPHCTADKKCLMRDAEGTIKSVNEEEKFLCESCKKKLPEK